MLKTITFLNYESIAFPVKIITAKKSIKEIAMASGTNLMVKALDIKGMHVYHVEYVTDEAVMYGEP